MRHDEDLRLVRRMLAGDERAFDEFAERYTRPLYRFAASRLDGDRERVRDLTQTALVKALAKLDTYRGDASLMTWLCSCCRNEILMSFRSRKAAPRRLELVEDVEPAVGFVPAVDGDPGAALDRRETGQLVHAALDSLPEHYARALEWKYLEHLSTREVGDRLAVGAKAAESLLTRARQAFRASFESLTSGAAGAVAQETAAVAGARRPRAAEEAP